MDNNAVNTNSTMPVTPPAAQEKQPEKKKGDEEFSIAWHLKVLMVIYIILGILWVVLKFTLK